jgi:hypothetical protein
VNGQIAIAEEGRALRLWRVTAAADPYLGPRSFWTPSPRFAGWFARWKAEVYPELCPLAVFRADLRFEEGAVLDRRHHIAGASASVDEVTPDDVLAEADQLAERGVEWVLLSGGRDSPGWSDEGDCWSEAIRVAPEPVPATPI